MKCPKCGSEDVVTSSKTGASVCRKCLYDWPKS